MDAFSHCENLLREADKERYLATLFAPAKKRGALFSLYAFDLETAAVAERVHEPLAGEIRLQWWQDAISGKIAEQVAGSPVAAAFCETVESHALSAEKIAGLIAARRARLYESAETLDALRDYARETSGAVLSLACHILNGASDSHAERLSEAAAFPMLHDADIWPLSSEDEAFGPLREDLQEARRLIKDVPQAVLPIFLPLALVREQLKMIEQDEAPDISQLRQQWILWRASKNLARWLA